MSYTQSPSSSRLPAWAQRDGILPGRTDPSAATTPQLSNWLRVLWDIAPPMHFDAEAPFLTAGAVHLPPREHWLQHCAAATHAVAHLVYSPPQFDGTGLAPISRALLALLEDARVETLACRELPGLIRLWRPLHTATPDDGNTFEALMRRLARALADPNYDDPHPWIAKGRRLFFLDAELGMPALRTPAELRSAAMRLGHDIGQMRLQFNAKTYRPEPSFRDDHRWMWGADDLDRVQPQGPSPVGDEFDPNDRTPPDAGTSVTYHPEWDRLINRLRPEWTRVIEQPIAPPDAGLSALAAPRAAIASHEGRALTRPLATLARSGSARCRANDGEVLDLDALVDRSIARRGRLPADGRLYRAMRPHAERAAVWLIIDQSASTADRTDTAATVTYAGRPASTMNAVNAESDSLEAPTILGAATKAAVATAVALHAMGIDCTVAGFSSNGRSDIRMHTSTMAARGRPDQLAAQLGSLRSAGSTRLGAAIRHATLRLSQSRTRLRTIIVMSDGEPHDIDIHDKRYLVEDARHAVRAARKLSIRVICVAIVANDASAAARRIFGARQLEVLSSRQALVTVLRRLLPR